MNHRLLRSAILALGLCLAAPALSLAQALPAGLAQRPELSAAETSQVGQWLTPHIAKLSSDDPREIKAARDSILSPLRGPGVSVSFRFAMQESLARTLSTLAEDKRELVAVNALRIAGEIGHAALIPTLTKSLKDPRIGVRYGALYALRATLDAAKASPAITPATVTQILTELTALGSSTTDPRILDGVVLALESGAAIPVASLPGVRDSSISALGSVVQAQSKLIAISDKPDDLLPGMLRAATIAQSAVTGRVGEQLAPKLSLDLVGISADLIALSARLKARSVGNPADLATLLRSAESLLFLAASGMNAPVEQLKLADKLEANDTAGFDRGVGLLIGPKGRLTSAPFSFNADRFKIAP